MGTRGLACSAVVAPPLAARWQAISDLLQCCAIMAMITVSWIDLLTGTHPWLSG